MELRSLPLGGWTTEQRQAVVHKWLACTLRTYPEQTARFLLQTQDPFRNPAGRVFRECLPALFEELAGAFDAGRIRSILDEIVHLRAVQDFTPSQAVGFLFPLKAILREEVDSRDSSLAVLDERIDEAALLAFDLYMRCRAQIQEIKANEARRRVHVVERTASRRARS